MKRRKSARRLRAVSLIMLSGNLGATGLAMAQTSEETPAPAAETTTTSESGATQLKQVDVRGVNRAVNILNNEKVDSVFGFDKSIKDTPRSITSISKETLDKLNINNIDDLVVLSPGSFTQSFFGVAGSLDLRGTPGETYFRGVRRIDNPGNYPTPIGASDRIDIVRGPASPIFGPSKVGGYLNFVPKSERAQDKTDASRTAGEVGVTRGSFDKNVIHGEVGGPGDVAGKKFGYYLYAEGESSGSYYDNSGTDQKHLPGGARRPADRKIAHRIRRHVSGLPRQPGGWLEPPDPGPDQPRHLHHRQPEVAGQQRRWSAVGSRICCGRSGHLLSVRQHQSECRFRQRQFADGGKP